LIGAVLPVASRKRVTVRFTGTPTSTFGGGGGTKLFCSQAVKTTNSNMVTAVRETAAALRRALPFNLSVNECVGFIPAPQFILFQRRLFGERFSPTMDSNNLLAVKPERENDPRSRRFVSPC
jgi:hypothetical protein